MLYRVIEAPLEKVKIGKRVRKDLGDLRHLINSFKKFGQVSPIILNEHYELIAGNRRLEAARQLGWAYVKAIIVDRNTDLEMLELELEENIQRLDLTPEEVSDGFDRMEKLRSPSLLQRLLGWIARLIKKVFPRR